MPALAVLGAKSGGAVRGGGDLAALVPTSLSVLLV